MNGCYSRFLIKCKKLPVISALNCEKDISCKILNLTFDFWTYVPVNTLNYEQNSTFAILFSCDLMEDRWIAELSTR